RAPHGIFMAFERLADRLAGRGVPDARRRVPRRCDNALAVRAERGAQYTAAQRLPDWLPGRGVPDARRHVIRRGDDMLAVGLNAALTAAPSWPTTSRSRSSRNAPSSCNSASGM